MYKIVDNIMINFEDYDDGKEIVLLHNWGQNLEEMDSLGRELNGNRKILLDFPGFGDSEEPNEPYDLDDYADVLRRLLSDLNVNNPIVVGHSFGGKVAIKYASQYDVEKLILIATPYKSKNETFKDKLFYTNGKSRITSFIKKCVGPDDYKNSSAIMKETFVNVVSENVMQEAKTIKVPTLIICGNNEKYTPITMAEELNNQMVNSSIIELQGSSDSYLKNTTRMANLLNKYIDGHKVRKRIK